MIEIVRVYVIDPKTKKETSRMEQNDIIKVLKKATDDVDLDYKEGNSVKMGSSRDFIGKTVKIGEVEFEIPEH